MKTENCFVLPALRRSRTAAALLACLGFVASTLSVAAPGSEAPGPALPIEGTIPTLAGATDWINSSPLAPQVLRGKVVLLNVWTYTCINSLRPMPYVRAWAEKYRSAGLVVIGVHTPEFSFEKNPANVRRFIQALGVEFPVAIDSRIAIWNALDNQYWPAFYVIDAQGRIRHRQFGEGRYDQAERVIQQLLLEAGGKDLPTGLVAPKGEGVEAAAGPAAESQETYLGYDRATGFASRESLVRDRAHTYESHPLRRTDEWSLQGDWTVAGESANLDRAGGRISFRFKARDLHMVLGSVDGKPVRFRVRVDGKLPLADHGTDIDEQGNGKIDGPRLYQLVRQSRTGGERVFEIEFQDPGAQAYVFTFG